jgi:DNA helicase HerA-like ATPase
VTTEQEPIAFCILVPSTCFCYGIPKMLPSRPKPDHLVLGHHTRLHIPPLVRVATSVRAAHIYVVGMSGKGKSKFLEACLYQDIAAGCGCGLIDPHSLLADDLLRLLITRNVLDKPKIRHRLIYVDPARTDFVILSNDN